MPVKKRRKLTDEQRAAAAARLKIAREKKLKKNPPQNKSIHPDVVALPDTDPFCLKNVKKWIVHNKELRQSYTRDMRKGDKNAISQHIKYDTYVKNLERYLREGVYVDAFFGANQEFKVMYRVKKPAYHQSGPYKGEIKRTVGMWYSDVGKWTQEMNDEYYK